MVVVYTILSAIIGPLKSIRLGDFLGKDNLIYFGWFTVFVILVYNNSDTLPKLTKEYKDWYPSPPTRNLGYNPENQSPANPVNQSRNPGNINNFLIFDPRRPDISYRNVDNPFLPPQTVNPDYIPRTKTEQIKTEQIKTEDEPRTEFTFYNPSTWSTWFRN